MKNRNIILSFALGIGTIALSSCDSFLDKMPDNRTELTSASKTSELLVSAYPTNSFVLMAELMSDNVTDNGSQYKTMDRTSGEAYGWKDITAIMQDSRQGLWFSHYSAIAAANHALQYINSVENPESLSAQKGEALICRAYAHFILVNMFCQQYNEKTSTTDMGIPFVEKPETVVEGKYERTTVDNVYKKINDDIEAGLPLINDNAYNPKAIKYHFNQKASYAFAAKFNLFYHKYDKTVAYASKALGANPQKMTRDYTLYMKFSSYLDFGTTYIRADQNCNFLLLATKSNWPRIHEGYERYAQNMTKLKEICWLDGPWGTRANFYPAAKQYGSNQLVYTPKLNEFFEVTDALARTGYINMISTAATADETLLCRAEAYTMLKDYTNATADLTTWYNSHTYQGAAPALVLNPLTRNVINTFYAEGTAVPVLRPALNPKYTIEAGEQTNFIYCILHFRRCETIHEGLRWFDIKRFGIEVIHPISGQKDDILTKDDLRRAVQLPSSVIDAGMPANPR